MEDTATLMEQYFNNVRKVSESRSNKKGPSTDVINLTTTKTLGTAIIKLILPNTSTPMPIRTIYDFYDVTVPYQPIDKDTKQPKVYEDGNPVIYRKHIRFMDISGYTCQLTDQQKELYDQVILNLTRWDECKGYMEEESQGSTRGLLWYEYRKQVTIFYGYLIAFSSNGNSDIDQGGVRLFRSSAGDFVDKFTSATSNKTKRKGTPSWMASYINRNAGTQCEAVTITTSRPNIAYETTVEFDECQPFTIKPEDIEVAGDITTELVDQSFFDQAAMTELNNELIKCINAYKDSHRNNFGSDTSKVDLPM